MPTPLRSFAFVFLIISIFGLLVGTLNLHNPEAVHIPFGKDENGVGQSAEGLDGIIASTLSAAVLGLVFGGLAAFFSWMFRLGLRNKDQQSLN